MFRHWRPEAVRDLLVVLLTVTTGAVNAACFLHLGHVFASVVTGTMVLLGVAAGTKDPVLAANCGVALASYTAGVLIGAPLVARSAGQVLPREDKRPAWPPGVTRALTVESCVLIVFCVGWEVTGGRPAGAVQLVLLAVLSVAMGIQGATVRQFGEISTTYLTGTLTGVVAALATRQVPNGLARSVGIFAALVIGALSSALITTYLPGLLPVVILVPLVLVVGLAAVRFRLMHRLRLMTGRR